MKDVRDGATGKYRSPGDERGFTLPEVLIVIAIMGILAAIAIPTWWGVVESRQVDSATNQLTADLRLAHSKATNQLVDWAVVSDPGSFATSAGVTFLGGTPTGSDYYLIKIPSTGTTIIDEDIERRDLGEGDKAQIATSTPVSLRFKPDGSIRAANNTALTSPVTVTVHKNGGNVSDAKRHDIEINAVTSRVTIVY